VDIVFHWGRVRSAPNQIAVLVLGRGRNREWSSAGSASAKGGMRSPPPFAGRCPQKRVRVHGCLMIFSLIVSVESEDDGRLTPLRPVARGLSKPGLRLHKARSNRPLVC
jgi:hypothetical protein